VLGVAELPPGTYYFQWLNIFQLAQAGDIKWQRVLQRYDQAIASKVEQERLNKMLDTELVNFAWLVLIALSNPQTCHSGMAAASQE
jgi:hypothetical protein